MKQLVIILGITALIIGGIVWLQKEEPVVVTQYPGLAQCLKDKGAKFFGAFWCPHCQNQKKIFGNEQDALPYIECSMPDGKQQTSECREQSISSYPTWQFADGSRLTGEIAPETLAEKTGCSLP